MSISCMYRLTSFLPTLVYPSHQSKRFKSLMKIRPKVKHFVRLTGSPTGNGLMDLWAQFRLLDLGKRLGRFIGQYRSEYFIPNKRNGQVIFSYKPLLHAEEAIYKQISDTTISMKSTDHLKMPELIHSEYPVCFSESERKTYDELKRDLVLQLPNGDITLRCQASLTRWKMMRFTLKMVEISIFTSTS